MKNILPLLLVAVAIFFTALILVEIPDPAFGATPLLTVPQGGTGLGVFATGTIPIGNGNTLPGSLRLATSSGLTFATTSQTLSIKNLVLTGTCTGCAATSSVLFTGIGTTTVPTTNTSTSTIATYIIQPNILKTTTALRFSVVYGYTDSVSFGCAFSVNFANANRTSTTSLAYTIDGAFPKTGFFETDVLIFATTSSAELLIPNTIAPPLTGGNTTMGTYESFTSYDLTQPTYLTVEALRTGGSTAVCKVIGATLQVIYP